MARAVGSRAHQPELGRLLWPPAGGYGTRGRDGGPDRVAVGRGRAVSVHRRGGRGVHGLGRQNHGVWRKRRHNQRGARVGRPRRVAWRASMNSLRLMTSSADLDSVDFAKGGGTITVVTQDASTRDVLMVAHADREALERSLSTGEMHYRSRSRGLWRKGATSGNTQQVRALYADCDG